jgi:phage tail sheath protein FI
MPEYLAPGVYIEEIELGAKPIEGVSTSNAGFLGQTERGPMDVRLVTSFGQFQSLYGGHIKDSFMAYAVDAFYRNGGQRCFVGRVVKDGALPSSLNQDPLQFEAVGPGLWGDRVAFLVENASLDDSTDPTTPNRTDLFKLTVGYWKDEAPFNATPPLSNSELIDLAAVLEIYDNVSTNSTSPAYYLTKVNAASNLVRLEDPPNTNRPDNTTEFTRLSGGSDGTDLSPTGFKGDPSAPPGQRQGLEAFKEVDEINIVYVPDLMALSSPVDRQSLTLDVVAHCENMKDRFGVLDADKETTNISTLRPPTDSKYAAFYYPWVKVFDPLSSGQKLVPPGGSVVGIYARSDTERGVHKAPANEVVRGALNLEFNITKGEQDLLNPRGVNVIRSFPARGIRVWGARTISTDPLWKYINVRRLFLFIEESIDEGTQWVVFEPNNEQLWARVNQTVTQFLTTVWRTGALMGTKVEEAFFVKVDRSTMTQDDIDNGRLIILIGIAPTKPAEFVIFRIAQATLGAEG